MKKIRNIVVITPWSFRDGLIQAYTLPYLRLIAGFISPGRIYLVTSEQDAQEISEEERKSAMEVLERHRISWRPSRYYPFGMWAVVMQFVQMLRLVVLIKKKHITHIHAWTTPAGVMAYCLSLLTGKPLILDSFEPHAEAQVENGTWTRSSIGFRALWFFEKRMARSAQALIYTSENTIIYGKEKFGIVDSSRLVKPACVDIHMFNDAPVRRPDLLKSLDLEGKVVGIYAGKLGGIYHDVELFAFARWASEYWNGKFRLLMLTSELRVRIDALCEEAGCPPEVVINRFVWHAEIPAYMKLGDFGITLVKSVPSKKCCTPIKNGEYWASGLPVVITPNIGDDSAIIEKHGIGVLIEGFDEESVRRTLDELSEIRTSMDRVAIVAVAKRYRDFSIARSVYEKLYG